MPRPEHRGRRRDPPRRPPPETSRREVTSRLAALLLPHVDSGIGISNLHNKMLDTWLSVHAPDVRACAAHTRTQSSGRRRIARDVPATCPQRPMQGMNRPRGDRDRHEPPSATCGVRYTANQPPTMAEMTLATATTRDGRDRTIARLPRRNPTAPSPETRAPINT